MKTKVNLGTDLKLNVNIEPISGISMKDYDFTIEAYCFRNKKITIPKADATMVDKDNFIIKIDTNLTGAGYLLCKITAEIPDRDFYDGFRTEVVEFETDIEIVK